MKILIDADGCPVTKQACGIARQHNLQTLIFCDTSHEINIPGAETYTVDKGADSADFAVVNQAQKGDIVITQDYGLAAMSLSKNAAVLTQNGLLITDENIGGLLSSRHESKKLRMSGKRLKGPSKRTAEQDEAFVNALRRLIDERLNQPNGPFTL